MVATPAKLTYTRKGFTDDDVIKLRRELPLKQDSLPYEEVDFSNNEISCGGIRFVLEVCQRCPRLKVLKLYRNRINDDGARELAKLFPLCPTIEEVHLSHNRFTAVGVEVLVAAAAAQERPSSMCPIWLRVEQNEVADADIVFRELSTRLSICLREDERQCNARNCCKKMQVHLPFFNWQRVPAVGYPGKAGGKGAPPSAGPSGPPSGPPAARGAPAIAAAGPPGPTAAGRGAPAAPTGPAYRVPRPAPEVAPIAGLRLPPPGSRPSDIAAPLAPIGPLAATPNPPQRSLPAWDPLGIGRHRQAAAPGPGGPTGQVAPLSGKPTLQSSTSLEHFSRDAGSSATTQASEELEEVAPQKQDIRGGKRQSILLDSLHVRRISPAQLEAEDAQSLYTCGLCNFVVDDPVITALCSHSFCDKCFRKFACRIVEQAQKVEGEHYVTKIVPCPYPRCTNQLRKKDIVPLSAARGAGAGMINRLRSNLAVRCVHHPAHHSFSFGKDAEELMRTEGLCCNWAGDLTAYSDHLRRGCVVEHRLDPQDDGPDLRFRSCRHNFEANPDDQKQLTIRTNDLVKVVRKSESGWVGGVHVDRDTLQETGVAGWFPEEYLYPCSEEPFKRK